jgi:hypothetical protein
MPAPRIEALDIVEQRLGSVARAEVGEAFVVLSAGEFGGRCFAVGDVLIAEPGAGNGPVILVARGPGRPRLGSVCGSAVTGDAGEPCSGHRWRVAGGIRHVPSTRATADVASRFDRGARVALALVRGIGLGAARLAIAPAADAATVRAPGPQLALFGQVRAA